MSRHETIARLKEITVILRRNCGGARRYTACVMQQGADGPQYGADLLKNRAGIYTAIEADAAVRKILRDKSDKTIIEEVKEDCE